MIGNGDETILLEDDVLGKHALDIAAQRAATLGSGELAVEPILHENCDNPIAGFPTSNTRACGDHFASAIGTGDARELHPGVVLALDDHQVAII